jgi:hypothetical protein
LGEDAWVANEWSVEFDKRVKLGVPPATGVAFVHVAEVEGEIVDENRIDGMLRDSLKTRKVVAVGEGSEGGRDEVDFSKNGPEFGSQTHVF